MRQQKRNPSNHNSANECDGPPVNVAAQQLRKQNEISSAAPQWLDDEENNIVDELTLASNDEWIAMVEATDTSSLSPQMCEYIEQLALAAAQRFYLLINSNMQQFQNEYASGGALGYQMRAWRQEHDLDRSRAAMLLPSWDANKVTLLEQGWLRDSEISAAMREEVQQLITESRYADTRLRC